MSSPRFGSLFAGYGDPQGIAVLIAVAMVPIAVVCWLIEVWRGRRK